MPTPPGDNVGPWGSVWNQVGSTPAAGPALPGRFAIHFRIGRSTEGPPTTGRSLPSPSPGRLISWPQFDADFDVGGWGPAVSSAVAPRLSTIGK